MDATLRDNLDPEGDQPLRRGSFDLLALVVSRRWANSFCLILRKFISSGVLGQVRALSISSSDASGSPSGRRVLVAIQHRRLSERSVADLRRALKRSRSNRDSGL